MTPQPIVAVFPSRTTLTRALDHLNTLDRVACKRLAVVGRRADGQPLVVVDHITPAQAGRTGLLSGALLAIVGGVLLSATLPLIAVLALSGALAGAIIGRLIARLNDRSFPREQTDALAQWLHEGRLALMLELDERPEETLAFLRDELKPYLVELIEPLHRAVTRREDIADADAR